MGILLNGSDMSTVYGFRTARPVGWADAPSRQTTTMPFLNRQGAKALTLPQEQPRKLTLSGFITGSSVSDRLAKADALKVALTSPSGVQLIFPDQPGRYITATLDTFTVNGSTGPAFIERTLPVDIGMTALDPYFYDTTLTTLNVSGATSVLLGTAPSRPVLTMAGANSNPLTFSLSVTGPTVVQQMSLSGALAGGEILIIDCDAMTITKNGVNALALLTAGDFFRLDPTLASPTLIASGSAPFTCAYRKAWR